MEENLYSFCFPLDFKSFLPPGIWVFLGRFFSNRRQRVWCVSTSCPSLTQRCWSNDSGSGRNEPYSPSQCSGRINTALTHIKDQTTVSAAHCLGAIPRFRGLTGKDYQQLPFIGELSVNQTPRLRISLHPELHAPARRSEWGNAEPFRSNPRQTNGFSPTSQRQEPLKGLSKEPSGRKKAPAPFN